MIDVPFDSCESFGGRGDIGLPSQPGQDAFCRRLIASDVPCR